MKSGRLFFVLVIGFVFVYLIYAMRRFDNGSAERQVESVRRIIDQALVQCYALEGSYPTNIEHIGAYGVLFDHDRYYYVYEYIGGNLRPSVMVLER